MRTLLFVWLFAFFTVGAHATEPEFDAETGYRIARYRSPVPESVDGGSRITAPDVTDLVAKQSAILVDVMPSEGPGPDPVTGHWLGLKPRRNIPGSIWLPDVGKGALTPAMDDYFRKNLAVLTKNNLTHAIILYCQADCWMSWNAVKRAASYGYKSLYWYPEGSDGWRDWDGQFVDATAVPLPPKSPAP